jgi:hypothetical protein
MSSFSAKDEKNETNETNNESSYQIILTSPQNHEFKLLSNELNDFEDADIFFFHYEMKHYEMKHIEELGFATTLIDLKQQHLPISYSYLNHKKFNHVMRYQKKQKFARQAYLDRFRSSSSSSHFLQVPTKITVQKSKLTQWNEWWKKSWPIFTAPATQYQRPYLEQVLHQIPIQWLNQIYLLDSNQPWYNKSLGGEFLLVACSTGDHLLVQHLIRHLGVNPNYSNNNGEHYPLQTACYYLHLTVIQLLLESIHVNPHYYHKNQYHHLLEYILSGSLKDLVSSNQKKRTKKKLLYAHLYHSSYSWKTVAHYLLSFLSHFQTSENHAPIKILSHQSDIFTSLMNHICATHNDDEKEKALLELLQEWIPYFDFSSAHLFSDSDPIYLMFQHSKLPFLDLLIHAGLFVSPHVWIGFDRYDWSTEFEFLWNHPDLNSMLIQPQYEQMIHACSWTEPDWLACKNNLLHRIKQIRMLT